MPFEAGAEVREGIPERVAPAERGAPVACRTLAPWIPPEAEGLVAAIEADRGGDGEPLRAWYRTGFPTLVASAGRTGLDRSSAEELASAVVEAAWSRPERAAALGSETGWLARVARNLRADRERVRRKFVQGGGAPGESAGGVADRAVPPAEESDLLVRVAAALPRLPPPYREALAGRLIEGWSARACQEFLSRWWGVGREGARRILRVGRVMLRATLAGADPRERWPRRYGQEGIVDSYPTMPRPRQKGRSGGHGARRGAPGAEERAPWPARPSSSSRSTARS